jgi:CBS domain containing-hemolysin-like protein
VPLFSAGLTLAILFLAEILPKTLGAVHWRKWWPSVVWPVTAISYVLHPFVYITQKFAERLTRGHKFQTVTEEEILAVVRIGAREGEISDRESTMVHNIIDLENKRVREIMTPRTVIFSLDAGMPVEEAFRIASGKGFTRIMVHEDDKENVVGYVLSHDLGSAATLSKPKATLRSIAKPISFVPEMVNCLTLLSTFLQERLQIAAVVDEYGGLSGLVTLEDFLETMLGAQIVDERDREVDLRESARKKGRKPAST